MGRTRERSCYAYTTHHAFKQKMEKGGGRAEKGRKNGGGKGRAEERERERGGR